MCSKWIYKCCFLPKVNDCSVKGEREREGGRPREGEDIAPKKDFSLEIIRRPKEKSRRRMNEKLDQNRRTDKNCGFVVVGVKRRFKVQHFPVALPSFSAAPRAHRR